MTSAAAPGAVIIFAPAAVAPGLTGDPAGPRPAGAHTGLARLSDLGAATLLALFTGTSGKPTDCLMQLLDAPQGATDNAKRFHNLRLLVLLAGTDGAPAPAPVPGIEFRPAAVGTAAADSRAALGLGGAARTHDAVVVYLPGADLEPCDRLVSALLPEAEGGAVHLTAVVGPAVAAADPGPGPFRPAQSFQSQGGVPQPAVSPSEALLAVSYQAHYTRRDPGASLVTGGYRGQSRIVAGRFMHEVAFLVGCVPKYGA